MSRSTAPFSHSKLLSAVAATALLCGPALSQTAEQQPPSVIPSTVADSAAKLNPQMAKVLSTLAGLEPKPIETLSASEARDQPTPADAVKKIIKDEGLKADPHQDLKVSTSYFANMGDLRLRFYTPANASSDAKLPVVVYFRGGGWVIANLDVYDTSPAAIARKGNVIVVSVDYPMAPEKKFPAAHEEAVRAYEYVLKNAESWGGDPAKIAIVGESAGGNLAVNTAIAARDKAWTAPRAVVAVYPVAATTMDTPSKKQHAHAKPLNNAMLSWFFDKVLNDPKEAQDPRLNLVAANLQDLPPVTIITAEVDPLKSDGDLLAEKLKAAGNQVTLKNYNGVAHEFFGMDAVVPQAAEAQGFAVSEIRKGFDRPDAASTVGTAPQPAKR